MVSTRLSPRTALDVVTRQFQSGPRPVFVPARERSHDLAFLARLIDQGKLRVPVDRTFSFDDISHAHRYLESGEARGKVVVRMV